MSARDTPIRPPPLLAVEVNGSEPTHRHTLATIANTALEAKQAALEAHGMVGELMREVGGLSNKVDRLIDKVDAILIPPARQRVASISDLEKVESTDSGTNRYIATHEQLDRLVDARIKSREEQRSLEQDARPKRFLEEHATKAFASVIVMAIVAAFAGLWSMIKKSIH